MGTLGGRGPAASLPPCRPPHAVMQYTQQPATRVDLNKLKVRAGKPSPRAPHRRPSASSRRPDGIGALHASNALLLVTWGGWGSRGAADQRSFLV